jgi:predicted aspartyl protease
MNYRFKTPSHVFTLKASGLANVLIMELAITASNVPEKSFKTKAIWDTGATATVITKEVFDHLDLKPVGMKMISTATISNQQKETYLVDVFLKEDLRVQAVEVTVGNIAAEHGINCLIGMDIITLGDFSITNLDGKTCMSFRIPSQHEVDFYQKMQKEVGVIERHIAGKRGMNNPCICNSGKKFKNCHGKDLEIY